MKVAYFLNHYPKVSHSFIRREIVALEKKGLSVDRFSLKTDSTELVDDDDKAELIKTRYLLKQPIILFVRAVLFHFIRDPIRFLKTLGLACRIGWNSDRGLSRHIIYFVEACLLERWVKQSGATHIHAHFGNNSAAVVMLTRRLGGPSYSFTVHGPIEFDKPEFMSLDKKIKHASFVVAISSFGKSQLFRWIPHDLWPRVKKIHCGLEESFYNVNLQPVRQNGKLVCVGRLCEQKGQLLLVEAAIQLAKEGEVFQLVLVGDGPMRKELEALIEKNDMESRITITGWVSSDRVREELLGCTALVLPSFAEGLPVVIMEAMALKRPVITTYIAGIPELVIPGENGWLIPAGSTAAIVESIRELLNSTEDYIQDLGECGQQRVIARHNIDSEAEKLAQLFFATDI